MQSSYKTIRAAAKGLNRSPQQVSNYISRGLPKNPDGSLSHDTCVRWIQANISNPKESRSGGETGGSISAADCADIVFSFGQSILDPDDVFQHALKEHGRKASRALAIDLVDFLASTLIVEYVSFDKAAVFARLDITQEAANYPDVVKALGKKVGAPER